MEAKPMLGFLLLGLLSCSNGPTALPAQSRQEAAENAPQRKIPYVVAATYRNMERTWRIVVVKGGLSASDLIVLAKHLRQTYRGEPVHIYDDGSQVKAYENWTVNYPDPRYPYPEAWVNKHHLGMINLMLTTGGARWYLIGGAAHPTRAEERIIELP